MISVIPIIRSIIIRSSSDATASRRVPGAQETQHLDAQVEDLALGGPCWGSL